MLVSYVHFQIINPSQVKPERSGLHTITLPSNQKALLGKLNFLHFQFSRAHLAGIVENNVLRVKHF